MTQSPKPIRVPYYLQVLRSVLESRRGRNPRYSLRAFAKYLGMDASAMSRVLRGKQELTAGNCVEILCKLKLTRVQQRIFIQSVVSERFESEFESIMSSVQTLVSVMVCAETDLQGAGETQLDLLLKLDPVSSRELGQVIAHFVERVKAHEEIDSGASTHRLSMSFGPFSVN